ncbi:glycosyltransferase family 4 protein [Exiguobacterium profundum]|uniref:Glycosyltransferase family 4 protein n=2 Tax=Bacilli TaxID=91061 RepID=A0ABY8B416_9BACL|nr:glycosyltransferase family 4 protein [Exiguobacterium profundum]WED55921.1 glycosyltransferase family 4 protein [Exiguobacterium profundum]
MNVLLPVFFHSAMGGLHRHILSSVKVLIREGHEVTVVCKPGPFAKEVEALGGQVIRTDYSNEDVTRVIDVVVTQSFDLVYAHPFDSRQVGLAVAETHGIPFVLVIHGMYYDEIEQYHTSVSRVIAVSERIATHLVEHCPAIESKLIVIPNGVDDAFVPDVTSVSSERVTGLFTSRLDADKLFILDVFLDALEDERIKSLPIDWLIVGDGTQREKYASRYEEALEGTSQTMDWLGWVEQDDLPEVMRRADFVIAPGRSALEGMAVGKPTIAVGSKSYQGLVTPSTWQDIASTNFGGIGTKYDGYTSGRIGDAILELMDETTRRELARFSAALVDEHFRDEAAQRLLLDLLEEVRREGPKEIDLVARYPHVRYDQLHARRANRLCSWKLADREQRLEAMRNELEATKRHLDELRAIQSNQSTEISQLRSALQRLSDETE